METSPASGTFQLLKPEYQKRLREVIGKSDPFSWFHIESVGLAFASFFTKHVQKHNKPCRWEGGTPQISYVANPRCRAAFVE